MSTGSDQQLNDVQTYPSHHAVVGGISVRRALPQRTRRTVGPWCFADHLGPASVTANDGLDVGPHPHVGLQTVTWLIDGHVLHQDSLGTEQMIRPGELNLMTAGHGIVHAEETAASFRGVLEGIQLWIAQPDRTREAAPAFAHYDNLPRVELGSTTTTVVLGELLGSTSPARRDSELIGLDLDLRATATLPLRSTFEHAVIVLRGSVQVGTTVAEPGSLVYVAPGIDELRLAVRDPSRAMVIGGRPFEEPLVMWWNFVARRRDELAAAYQSWTTSDGRFAAVASKLAPIEAPVPYWLRSER